MVIAVDHQPDFEVLCDSQLGEQPAPLRDIADAVARHLVGGKAGHLDAAAFDAAACRADQPHDGLQAGALPGAVPAEKADNFAGRHVE